jgi:L-ascorbate metabolism protein UlaG (beta-lactamase superfamily)
MVYLHQTKLSMIEITYFGDSSTLPDGTPGGNTMEIGDATKAAKFVGTNTIMAMHDDTFPYIQIDQAAAKKLAAKEKINLVLCNIGENLTL